MKKKDNIEELIRQKLREKDFPYGESYWAGAREAIAADRRKRQRRMFFWLLIGLLTLISLALWLWPTLTPNRVTESPAAQKENAEAKASAMENHIKLWNFSVDDSTQTNKLFITRSASEAPLAGASNEAYSENDLVSGPPQKVKILHGADFQLSAVSDSRPPDGNTDLAFTDGKQASERSEQTVTERNSSDGSSDTGFFPEKTTPSLSRFSTLAIHSPELSAQGELPPLQDIRRLGRSSRRPDLLFQLGGGGALGLNGQHHRYLESGLAARFYLQPRLHILGGASYWLRLNKDQLATRSITNYDYTSRTTEYRLDVHQMHYLEFWVGLEYQAAPRLAVLAGLSHARLLGNLATYQVNEHYRNQVEQVQHRRSMGFREGFNRQDWRIRAGLSYRLNALSELAVEMRIGLTDITHNEHFDATKRDENTFAGVTLRYKIDRR